MRKNTSTIEYLAFISAKYEADPDKLFYALILAEKNKKASCGDLSIQWRSETKDKIMFLILTSNRIVAQLSVFKDFLLEKGQPIRDFMETEKIRRFLVKRARRSSVSTIRDLRAGMTQIRLKAKVLEIPKPNLVCTRYGNYASVANALISDGTGTINLCLWNEQIRCISPGDTIQIENASARTFKGQRQLHIGKKGLLTVADEPTLKVKALIGP